MKGKQLPKYVIRRRGILKFRKRIGSTGKYIEKKLNTQFPEGELVPFALHQEVERLLEQPDPIIVGTELAYVIDRYQRSDLFLRKADRTRADYIKRLEFLRRKLGHLKPRHIERHHVIRWRDQWGQKSPHEANYRLRVMKIVMERAIDYGLLVPGANPAKGVSEIEYERRERDPWPADLVKDAREHATGRTALLFELLLGTGQRVGDVLKMKWSDYDGEAISLRQGKTKERLWVPVTARLKTLLDAQDRRSVFVLTNQRGTAPWSYRGAHDAMMKLRRDIGAEAFDMHSLRYTATAELARVGLNDEQIQSVTGHKTRAMVQRYAGPERQKARARIAQKTRDRRPGTEHE